MAGVHERSCVFDQRSRRTGLRTALIALLAVGSAACGSTASPTRGSTSTTRPARFAPDAVVAQVAERGGFIGPIVLVHQIASITVLGDGTVVTPAPIPMISPGPAITPLEEGHIAPAEIERLLADAGRLGLLDDPLDFGHPGVSDMGTTTVRIDDGTRTVVQSAYALGFDDPAAPNLTGPQRSARSALQSFIKELQALPAGRRAFTPRAVAVFTLSLGAAPGAPQTAPRPWPVATLPALATSNQVRCVVVSGAEIAPLLAALAHANENTPWRVGSRTFTLAFRPLAPGEACIL